MPETTTPRRFTNIHVTQIIRYRLPAAGIVSILHRISGAMMFVLLPFVVWMLDASLSTEISFDVFKNAFVAGLGPIPGVLVKLVALAVAVTITESTKIRGNTIIHNADIS